MACNSGRSYNKIFVINGYGAGGSARTSYWRVPFPADNNDDYYTLTPNASANEMTISRNGGPIGLPEFYITVTVLLENSSHPVEVVYTPAS